MQIGQEVVTTFVALTSFHRDEHLKIGTCSSGSRVKYRDSKSAIVGPDLIHPIQMHARSWTLTIMTSIRNVFLRRGTFHCSWAVSLSVHDELGKCCLLRLRGWPHFRVIGKLITC